jgi:hypothetical protein
MLKTEKLKAENLRQRVIELAEMTPTAKAVWRHYYRRMKKLTRGGKLHEALDGYLPRDKRASKAGLLWRGTHRGEVEQLAKTGRFKSNWTHFTKPGQRRTYVAGAPQKTEGYAVTAAGFVGDRGGLQAARMGLSDGARKNLAQTVREARIYGVAPKALRRSDNAVRGYIGDYAATAPLRGGVGAREVRALLKPVERKGRKRVGWRPAPLGEIQRQELSARVRRLVELGAWADALKSVRAVRKEMPNVRLTRSASGGYWRPEGSQVRIYKGSRAAKNLTTPPEQIRGVINVPRHRDIPLKPIDTFLHEAGHARAGHLGKRYEDYVVRPDGVASLRRRLAKEREANRVGARFAGKRKEQFRKGMRWAFNTHRTSAIHSMYAPKTLSDTKAILRAHPWLRGYGFAAIDRRRVEMSGAIGYEGGVPLTGKVARDRWVKKLRDEDLDRRDANLGRAGAAGAVAGALVPSRKLGLYRRMGAGALAGSLGVLAVRQATKRSKDPYGERSRGAKRAESIPAVAGLGVAGALAARRLGVLRKVRMQSAERRIVELASKKPEGKRGLNPYVGAAVSGAVSGGALGLVPLLKRGTRVLPTLRGAAGLAAASAGIVGGGALLGSKIIGKPREEEGSAFTKRAAIGGAAVGAGLGLAGALALRKTRMGARWLIQQSARNSEHPASRVLYALRKGRGYGGLASAAGIGAVGGGLYGGATGADEGQQVDSIRSLRKDLRRDVKRAATRLGSRVASVQFAVGAEQKKKDSGRVAGMIGAVGVGTALNTAAAVPVMRAGGTNKVSQKERRRRKVLDRMASRNGYVPINSEGVAGIVPFKSGAPHWVKNVAGAEGTNSFRQGVRENFKGREAGKAKIGPKSSGAFMRGRRTPDYIRAHEIGHVLQNPKAITTVPSRLMALYAPLAGATSALVKTDRKHDKKANLIAGAATAASMPVLANEIVASAKGYKVMRKLGASRLRAAGAFMGVPSYAAWASVPALAWGARKLRQKRREKKEFAVKDWRDARRESRGAAWRDAGIGTGALAAGAGVGVGAGYAGWRVGRAARQAEAAAGRANTLIGAAQVKKQRIVRASQWLKRQLTTFPTLKKFKMENADMLKTKTLKGRRVIEFRDLTPEQEAMRRRALVTGGVAVPVSAVGYAGFRSLRAYGAERKARDMEAGVIRARRAVAGMPIPATSKKTSPEMAKHYTSARRMQKATSAANGKTLGRAKRLAVISDLVKFRMTHGFADGRRAVMFEIAARHRRTGQAVGLKAWAENAPIVDQDGNPLKWTAPMVLKHGINEGRKLGHRAQRGGRLLRDVSEVAQGKKTKKREWDKAWFRNTVATGLAGAAALGHSYVMRTGKMRRAPNWMKGYRSNVNKVGERVDAVRERVMKRADNLFMAARVRRMIAFDYYDPAQMHGWDMRDVRGRSARVFAPGTRKRVRRQAEWHETKQGQRKILTGMAIAGVLAGTGGGVLVGRKLGQASKLRGKAGMWRGWEKEVAKRKIHKPSDDFWKAGA